MAAIAEFLRRPETKPPLTLSVEGKWGSGKSSFMKQLEGVLKNEGEKTVWFNAWRHDKAEQVWAAFALSFIQQLSTPQENTWSAYWQTFQGHWRLAVSRFDLKKGWLDLLQVAAIGLFVVCAVIAIPLILLIYGWQEVIQLVQAFQSPSLILDALLKGLGILGSAGLSGAGILALLKWLQGAIGNPKLDLVKYLKAPDYKGQVAFVEKFHADFKKIVDAYVGKGDDQRVFVFVDDLDRCEHPKSADLMQAINLMIAEDPSVVFILGMDREKVAASLAVKYEKVLQYLPKEASDIDPDLLERYAGSRGLAYGYSFIEKFVQLPFQVPRPSRTNFEQYLKDLAKPVSGQKSPTADPGQATQRSSFWRSIKLPTLFTRRGTTQGETVSPSPDTPLPEGSERTSGVVETGGQSPETGTEPTPETEIERVRQYAMEFEQDSELVGEIVLMVAPALDYNPRRIKQFLNVFRLKAYLAYITGLLDSEKQNGAVTERGMTLEQLGKFTAISLKWPLLLLALERDRELLDRLCEAAGQWDEPAEDESAKKKQKWSESVRYWSSHRRLRQLLMTDLGGGTLTAQENGSTPNASLQGLNWDKLLQVSPTVGEDGEEENELEQDEFVEQLLGGVELAMVAISAGSFLMGTEQTEIERLKKEYGTNWFDKEAPQHQVTLKVFQMGKYPVTQAQYEAVMSNNPSSFKDNPNNPVEQVSWEDAQNVLSKAESNEGKNLPSPHRSGMGICLPSGKHKSILFWR